MRLFTRGDWGATHCECVTAYEPNPTDGWRQMSPAQKRMVVRQKKGVAGAAKKKPSHESTSGDPYAPRPFPRTMRAAIYTRVSKLEQNAELQQHACMQRIADAGWTLIERFNDEGESGATARRPQLERLMNQIRKRRFDVLLVWKSDRLFRNLGHMVRTFTELTELDCAFVSVTESWDTSTPTGRLILHVMASFAEFERDLIVERTRAGMAAARRRGARIGRPKTRIDVDRALALIDEGLSRRQAAARMGISRDTMDRAIEREKTRDK